MGDIQFQEDTYRHVSDPYQNQKDSKMITLLIKSGLTKDKRQANIFLLSCAVVFLLSSAFAFSKTIEPKIEVIPYDEMTPQQKQKVPPQERNFLENIRNNQ